MIVRMCVHLVKSGWAAANDFSSADSWIEWTLNWNVSGPSEESVSGSAIWNHTHMHTFTQLKEWKVKLLSLNYVLSSGFNRWCIRATKPQSKHTFAYMPLFCQQVPHVKLCLAFITVDLDNSAMGGQPKPAGSSKITLFNTNLIHS